MPQNISRPATNGNNHREERARDGLLNAIAGLQQERQALAKLEEASTRAQEQSYGLPDRIREAEAALREARQGEQSRLANAFVSGSIIEGSPIRDAEQELEQAKAADAQSDRIRAAIGAEIVQVAARVRRREAALNEALADLVLDSPQFHALFDELTKAWARLRGIRKAFAIVQSALGGNMPEATTNRWRATVTLDHLAVVDSMGPIATDEGPSTAWQKALDELLTDPDAPLPGKV